MATFNFIRPNLSKENAEVQDYLLRLLNELDHIAFEDKANVNNYSTEITEVYQDSSIEEEASVTNGTYRKWKSGLAELWLRIPHTVTQTDSDNGYAATYPSLFISVPHTQFTVEWAESSSVAVASFGSSGTESVSPRYKFYNPFNTATSLIGKNIIVNIYAVGRWK